MKTSAYKVLITDDVHPLFMKKMQEAGIDYDFDPGIHQEGVQEIIPHYDAVIINSKITMNREMIDRAEKLQFIGRAGSGMEIIDTDYADEKGIRYANTPEGNRDAVGEHTIGLMLTLLNNIAKADREIRHGQWLREENRGKELRELTVGLLGYGHMGGAVAEKLYGFGAKIIAYDKYRSGFSDLYVQEVEQEQFFTETELLSIHLPLTPETKWLVNRSYLEQFEQLHYVVNTARGKNLVTSDLVKMLSENSLSGAALDVLEEENPDYFSKNFQSDFFNLIKFNKLAVTPHIAGWSNESKRKIADLLATRLISAMM